MALKDGFVAWWNFNGPDGLDSTGNNNTLTASGTAFSSGSDGKIGKGMLCNTTANATLAVANQLSFGGGSMSVTFWINVTGASGATSEGVMAKGVGTSNREWFIGQGLNWRVRFFTTDANNYIGVITNNSPVQAGVWQHVVITKDATNLTSGIKIYHNAVVQPTNDEVLGTYTGMVNNGGNFTIGTTIASTQRANGVYDLIGICNKELTQAEVTELYNGGAGLNLFPDGRGIATFGTGVGYL